ncbi:MAG: hypothetical protein QGH51_07035 [Planctomycetota bacterium]|jgi:hypothetical protein|nr:hypothetical protein [Planctomycetota bacterium]MDP6941765.1 hypothetical protein [Planctomycetota bacterium]
MIESQLPEDLKAFAEELRAAHPENVLSPGFAKKLNDERAPAWSFSTALRNNSMVRMAAGVLVFLTASVPILAVLSFIAKPEPNIPAIGFEPLQDPPQIEKEDVPAIHTIPPTVPPLAELLDESWRSELEKSNQYQQASLEIREALLLPSYFLPSLGWICLQ